MVSVFEVDSMYTRSQIGKVLGGNPQQFLPMCGGKVVCGCFRRDLNPGAPTKVLVGFGPQRERSARYLVLQQTAIPVFIKEQNRSDPQSWRYIGKFRAIRYQDEGPELVKEANAAGIEPIAGILYMEVAASP